MEALSYFHFLRPEWFLVIPLLIGVEWLNRTRGAQQDPFSGIIAPGLLDHLRVTEHRRGLINPGNTLLCLVTVAVLVLAGPSWRQQPSPLAEDAAPLILVMDVSASMATEDIAPSRLERASQKMRDLLQQAPDKRVGIIVFAGSAHTVLPLTGDHDIAGSYLTSLRPNMVPRDGKFAEYALPSIDRLLTGSYSAASVVLATDGLGSNSHERITAWCRSNRHQLWVHGIGTVESSQSDVPLQRDALEQLAGDCGGRYLDVAIDSRDVETIAGGLLESFVVIDDEAFPWLDGGYLLLFPALLLALLWFRPGWTRVWTWLLIPLCLSVAEPSQAQRAGDATPPVQSEASPTESEATQGKTSLWLDGAVDSFAGLWLTPDQYGRVLMTLGAYDRAARTFSDPMWQATARYYAQDFRQAAALFTRKDSDIALFNEANAHAQRRDYIRALRRYQTLLERSPDFPGAQQNRDLIQGIVDEVNRLSESQQIEAGVGTEEIDPGEDPQIGDGAEEMVMQTADRQQYSADELLANPETAALWLKNVQQDPSQFLRSKFSIQLEERGVSEP